MKQRVLIDNNCIDTLGVFSDIYKHLTSQYEFCVSSIIVEELASIPDDKMEKRIKTFIALSKAEVKFVLDAIKIYGVTRYDCCRYADEKTRKVYHEILNESGNNVKDAIIAATAAYENCILLTNDKELYKKMKEHGYAVMSFDELKAQYKAEVTNKDDFNT